MSNILGSLKNQITETNPDDYTYFNSKDPNQFKEPSSYDNSQLLNMKPKKSALKKSNLEQQNPDQ
jgi:hypothetical protein